MNLLSEGRSHSLEMIIEVSTLSSTVTTHERLNNVPLYGVPLGVMVMIGVGTVEREGRLMQLVRVNHDLLLTVIAVVSLPLREILRAGMEMLTLQMYLPP